jgi:hypothetical protein
MNEYLREYEFLDSSILPAKVCQQATLGHSGTVWDAALVLCAFLESSPGKDLLKDSVCIELGAGTAIVAIAASRLGTNRVVASDQEVCVPFMKQNIGMNMGIENCSAIELDWFKPETVPERDAFDWILCADCVYAPETIDGLIKTILTINPRRGIIVSNERREYDSNASAEKQFIKALLEAGYAGKAVHKDVLRPEWRCEDIDVVVFEKQRIKGA